MAGQQPPGGVGQFRVPRFPKSGWPPQISTSRIVACAHVTCHISTAPALWVGGGGEGGFVGGGFRLRTATAFKKPLVSLRDTHRPKVSGKSQLEQCVLVWVCVGCVWSPRSAGVDNGRVPWRPAHRHYLLPFRGTLVLHGCVGAYPMPTRDFPKRGPTSPTSPCLGFAGLLMTPARPCCIVFLQRFASNADQ